MSNKPYFYIIEHIPSNCYYAGVRFAKGCSKDELLKENGYKTSSKTVHQLIESDGITSFKINRIKEFDAKEDAMEYETRFLQKVNALHNEKFLNLNNNAAIEFYYPESVRKAMTIKKYGYEHILQVPYIRNKFKETCLKKYGVDHYNKTNEFKEKIISTCLSKYGVANVLQNNIIREKIKQTNRNRYGFDNYTKTDEYSEKVKTTCLKKYGVDHYSKTEEYKEKIKTTCLEKYGVDHYNKTDEFKEKIKQTSLNKYGVEHHTKTDKFKEYMKENRAGEKHFRFKGYYVTPNGKFTSEREIVRICPEFGAGVKRWCKNSSKIISEKSYQSSAYLKTNFDNSIIGKTYKDIGFYFENSNNL